MESSILPLCFYLNSDYFRSLLVRSYKVLMLRQNIHSLHVPIPWEWPKKTTMGPRLDLLWTNWVQEWVKYCGLGSCSHSLLQRNGLHLLFKCKSFLHLVEQFLVLDWNSVARPSLGGRCSWHYLPCDLWILLRVHESVLSYFHAHYSNCLYCHFKVWFRHEWLGLLLHVDLVYVQTNSHSNVPQGWWKTNWLRKDDGLCANKGHLYFLLRYSPVVYPVHQQRHDWDNSQCCSNIVPLNDCYRNYVRC